jgi:integrase
MRTGKPLDLANAARAFKRVLRAMAPEGQEPPRHTLYDLRHTFATLLLAGSSGSPPAPITYMAAQKGHANPATTVRFYARWIPRQGHRYIEGLLAVQVDGDAAATARGRWS